MKRLLYYLAPEHYITVAYQLIFLVGTLAILWIMLYKPIVEFHPCEPSPHVQPVTDQVTAAWGKQPVRVKTGMQVADFLRFDTVKNEYLVNAFIWFGYDAGRVSQETIDSFSFTKGEIVQKSPARISKQHDLTISQYNIRVQFSSIMDYSRFPLDDHRVFLNLTNATMSADQLIYEVASDGYAISDSLFIAGWQVVGNAVKSGYSQIRLSNDITYLQPKTVFSIDLSKADIRQLALILLPLLFLFYLSLFAFSLTDLTVAMTLPLAGVASLFAYSFVIQTLAPAVGYIMLSDYLFIFFLLASFVICLVRCLAIVPEHIMSKTMFARLQGLTVVGLQVLLIGFWYYLTSIWICNNYTSL